MNFAELAMWQQLIILIGALVLVVYLRALPYRKKKEEKSKKKHTDE